MTRHGRPLGTGGRVGTGVGSGRVGSGSVLVPVGVGGAVGESDGEAVGAVGRVVVVGDGVGAAVPERLVAGRAVGAAEGATDGIEPGVPGVADGEPEVAPPGEICDGFGFADGEAIGVESESTSCR
jgi:hypothetical protein